MGWIYDVIGVNYVNISKFSSVRGKLVVFIWELVVLIFVNFLGLFSGLFVLEY